MLICVACCLQFFQKSRTMNLSNLMPVCVACFLQFFQKSPTTNVSNHLICLFVFQIPVRNFYCGNMGNAVLQ